MKCNGLTYTILKAGSETYDGEVKIGGIRCLPNRRHPTPGALQAELEAAGFNVLFQSEGDAICVHGESETSGKAGGLKTVNRSKRLKTWRHLKVAINQTGSVDPADGLLLLALGCICERSPHLSRPSRHNNLLPKNVHLSRSLYVHQRSEQHKSHFSL